MSLRMLQLNLKWNSTRLLQTCLAIPTSTTTEIIPQYHTISKMKSMLESLPMEIFLRIYYHLKDREDQEELGDSEDEEESEDEGTREDNDIEDPECIAQGDAGVSSTCTGPAILELRLVSKDLNDKLTKTFQDEYFDYRSHLFSTKSIECLRDISENDKLGSSVRKLSVHPCLMERDGIDESRYTEYLDEQKSATTGGTDFDMFSASLANLPNCRSICISDDNGRPIWGLGSEFSSYINPKSSYHMEKFSQLFNVVLSAIKNAALPLETFSISPSRGGVDINALCIPTSSRDSLAQAFISLKTLQMRVFLPNRNVRQLSGLAQFISLCPQLTSLDLSFKAGGYEAYSYGATTFKGVAQDIHLQKLYKVVLREMCIQSHHLLLFFQKHVTLRVLDIWRVELSPGTWVDCFANCEHLDLKELALVKCLEDGRLVRDIRVKSEKRPEGCVVYALGKLQLKDHCNLK